MSETHPPTDPAQGQDIPLEDIDRLLESEDPEFAKSLEEVRAVENDKNVTIDASAIDESLNDGDHDHKVHDLKPGFKSKLKQYWASAKAKAKARAANAGKDFLIFLKTRPIEFLLYSFAMSKSIAQQAMIPIRSFQDASRLQRVTVMILIALATGIVWVLFANFRGVWIPQISEPLLTSFEPYADRAEVFNPKDEGESFYSAFPQERHEFLFRKMKVNLRSTEDSQNPMGAFEVIVLLDSMDTAIEVRDREVEFFDQFQRVFEEESFNDLESELGKSRLKSRLKRELNQKLTQGWAKDISFKTFILKP